MPIALAALSFGASLIGARHQRRAGENKILAQRKRNKITELENIRTRFRTAREALMARASSVAEATAMGGSATRGSSAQVGAASSIRSQFASNLNFLEDVSDLNREANLFEERAIDRSNRAAQAGLFSSALLGIGSIFG